MILSRQGMRQEGHPVTQQKRGMKRGGDRYLNKT